LGEFLYSQNFVILYSGNIINDIVIRVNRGIIPIYKISEIAMIAHHSPLYKYKSLAALPKWHNKRFYRGVSIDELSILSLYRNNSVPIQSNTRITRI
jgi:hypothetical protein